MQNHKFYTLYKQKLLIDTVHFLNESHFKVLSISKITYHHILSLISRFSGVIQFIFKLCPLRKKTFENRVEIIIIEIDFKVGKKKHS